MLGFLANHKSSLLIISGAIPGALLRMQVSKKLALYTQSKLLGLVILNTVATFFLGFFLAIQPKLEFISSNQELYLLLCVGFLGSFSTFSSFIFELYSFSLKHRFLDCFCMVLFSIFLGLFSVFLGQYFGNL